MIDLPPPSSERAALEVIQSQHLYYGHACRCGHRSRPEPGQCGDDPAWTVRLGERPLAGALRVALIGALSLRRRLSPRRIQELFADGFDLQLSPATINPCLHEAGGALEPLAEIHASDLPHVKETSWKEHAQLLWPWVLTSATTTVRTLGRRTQARLRGLTHPVGKARGLEDSLDPQARDFGNALRHCLKTVMAAVYAAREGPPPMALRALHAQQLNLTGREPPAAAPQLARVSGASAAQDDKHGLTGRWRPR